jgi:hypothetical protein
MSYEEKEAGLMIIIKSGYYFYPAYRHYGLSHTKVQCDLCKKQDISACIGYD